MTSRPWWHSFSLRGAAADPTAEPTETLGAVVGEGEIVLDPNAGTSEGEPVTGTLRLDGLEADDGTTFAPIEVTSDSIGFDAG